MPLSANTLIHFTKNKSALKGILSDNFHVFYCYETINLEEEPNSLYVPMVSFCDIPLSEAKEHISKYGNYGIGLTKEWAAKNGLNPVLYLANDSILSHSIKKATLHFVGDALKNDKDAEEARALLDVLRYVKNYEGILKRHNGTVTKQKYRFSDEREWRYIPSNDTESLLMLMSPLLSDHIKQKNRDVLSKLRLKFEPNDIKYIILKDESEIHEFIAHLRLAKGKSYSQEDIERLTTRIITSEQIKTDM